MSLGFDNIRYFQLVSIIKIFLAALQTKVERFREWEFREDDATTECLVISKDTLAPKLTGCYSSDHLCLQYKERGQFAIIFHLHFVEKRLKWEPESYL